jgi:hypothetical protein
LLERNLKNLSKVGKESDIEKLMTTFQNSKDERLHAKRELQKV